MLPIHGHHLTPLAALHASQSPEELHIMDNINTIIIIGILIVVCIWMFILWKNSRKMNDDIRMIAQQHSLVRHDERARQLCRAIHILNSNVTAGIDYVIRHDTPEQEAYIAEWTTDAPRPTEEEINSALLEISDVRHEEKYVALRRAEYPSIEEQLKAAYQARQGNNVRQLEVDEKIRHVQEKYPKTDVCV
jgi:signal transduction histidine kinase